MLREIKNKNMYFSLIVLSSCINLISVSADACDNVKLKQVLENQGLHGNITYSIELADEDGGCSQWHTNCNVKLEQTLPQGVYADPDELKKKISKLSAESIDEIHPELPAEYSYPTYIQMMERIKDCKVELRLPVHARHHLTEYEGGMAQNTIDPPKMLLLCCPKHPPDMCGKEGASKEKCVRMDVAYTLLTDKLVWSVPIDNMSYVRYLQRGTMLFLAGTVVNLYQMYLMV